MNIPSICNSAGADVAMLDTYLKNGQKLFDFIDSEKLRKFVDKTHDFNLLAALAGSIEATDIKKLNELGTDVIGFRSAVCSDSDRKNGVLEVNRVRKIVEILRKLNEKEKLLRSTLVF